MNYAQILSRKYKGRQWTITENDYESLVIHDGKSKPSKTELEAHWTEVESEISSENERRRKEKEFGEKYSIQEQLFAITDSLITGSNDFRVIKQERERQRGTNNLL